MKYKYMKEEWKEGNQTFFFEINSEGTVTRQIVRQEDQIFASNRPDFCLSETPIDFIEDLEIQKQEFEDYWTLANKPFMNEWDKLSKDVVINTEVIGVIEVIYPQGIIFSFGDVGFGIANYEECREKSGSEKIYTKNQIKGEVSGFDNVNLWVKVKNAEVI